MHIGMGTGFAHQRGEAYQDARLIREEFENCVLAEELGFDSVWITEHHFSDYSICTNPLQALSYLAGRTRRIRLGTQVIVVPWHDPVRLAEQIIMLDHVSDGRTILGFGRGLARHEFQGLRIDQSQARELYNEILSLVIPAIETGWIEGGETSLRNTLLLCRFHHRFVHEHGYSIEDGRFLDAEGRVVPAQGARPAKQFELGWDRVSAESNQPGWDGERVVYEWCVDALVC